MDFYKAISKVFGEERSALCRAEIEYLVSMGYDIENINKFLEAYALPVGIFDLLSMIRRSKLSIKDLEKSLLFLFSRHILISEFLMEHVEPYSRILDYGCGRGLITCHLAIKGFDVYGVDISEDYLRVAEKLAEKLNCKPKFYVVKGDRLPFLDGYFGVVLCVWTLHEIPVDQLSKILLELHRVLQEGGSIFIIDQEGVASFKLIMDVMNKIGFKLELEKSLSIVHDHGISSNAIVLKYRK